MKIIKIALLSFALAVTTGCAGYGSYDATAYKERQVQYKCKESANRNLNNAYIRKESNVRFADDREDAQRAIAQFNRRVESIDKSYNSCLNNGYKRIFEENLRRQISYKY